MRAMWILAIAILCCIMVSEARGWHRRPKHRHGGCGRSRKKALFHSFEEKAKKSMKKWQRRLCNKMGHLGGIFGDRCKPGYADDQSDTFRHNTRTSRNDFGTKLKTERETVIDLTMKLKSEQDRTDKLAQELEKERSHRRLKQQQLWSLKREAQKESCQILEDQTSQLAQELEKERANRRLKQQQLWSLKREARKETCDSQGTKFELEVKLQEQQRVESNLLSKLAAAQNRVEEISQIAIQLEEQVQQYKDTAKNLEAHMKHFNASTEQAKQALLTAQARCRVNEDQIHRRNFSLRLQDRKGQWPNCGALPKLASHLQKQGVHFNDKCELDARPAKEHALMFLWLFRVGCCVLLFGILKWAFFVATEYTNAVWFKALHSKLAQIIQLLSHHIGTLFGKPCAQEIGSKGIQLSGTAGQSKPEEPRDTQRDNTEHGASCGEIDVFEALATTFCNTTQDAMSPSSQGKFETFHSFEVTVETKGSPEDLPILEEVKGHDACQDPSLNAPDLQNLAEGPETRDSPEDLSILEDQGAALDAQEMESMRKTGTSDTPSSCCASASSEFNVIEEEEPDATRCTNELDTSSSCGESEFEIVEGHSPWMEEAGHE